MDKKLSVIIPFFNKWSLTHQVLFDLYSYNREFIDEVVLVDDCSTDDDVYGGIRWWRGIFGMENSKISIKHVEVEKNQGFLKSANLGMQSAKGDFLVLLSNDVRCPCSFTQDIRRLLSVPTTIVGGKILDYDTGWNKFYDALYPYLEGWLLACTKDAWKKLGGFDVRYAPCDYEDVDFSTKALDAGYGLTPLNNPKIVHLGAQSIGYNPTREAHTQDNKRRFEEKWVTKIS